MLYAIVTVARRMCQNSIFATMESMPMSQQAYLNGLMDFITHSPTPFHAVASIISKLSAAGYNALDMAGHWDLDRPHSNNGFEASAQRHDDSVTKRTRRNWENFSTISGEVG